MKRNQLVVLLICMMLLASTVAGCGSAGAPAGNGTQPGPASKSHDAADLEYTYEEFPLQRKGIRLHLDKIEAKGAADPEKNILLIHGVTYSSHEFDVNFRDYSLARCLARSGYSVWRLDIAGFGQSEEVKDGFMPDSDYAAADIGAAVRKIVKLTGRQKIDVLGWSWGTITTGRYAARHPGHIRKLVLYAPIITGIGEAEVTEPFHHNTWEHAADDFQKRPDGTIDYDIVEPEVVEIFCSSCWRYDADQSPNGGRRDVCVGDSHILIDLGRIKTPTLVICGDKDPYLNYDHVDRCLDKLPEGSAYEKIPGASHVAYIEAPYYHDFQDRLMNYLAA